MIFTIFRLCCQLKIIFLANEERTQGQILSDFLVQLEDYTPTVRLSASILV